MKLIPSFPKEFPGAVLLVQHMPASFTSQFAQQLAEISAIKVKEAAPGEIISPGSLYLCPGSSAHEGHSYRAPHTRRRCAHQRLPPLLRCHAHYRRGIIGSLGVGVILTGMGNDGFQGAQAIKAAGGYVIAQDEATSIIFGMNAEAIKTGAVDQDAAARKYLSSHRKTHRCCCRHGAGRCLVSIMKARFNSHRPAPKRHRLRRRRVRFAIAANAWKSTSPQHGRADPATVRFDPRLAKVKATSTRTKAVAEPLFSW